MIMDYLDAVNNIKNIDKKYNCADKEYFGFIDITKGLCGK